MLPTAFKETATWEEKKSKLLAGILGSGCHQESNGFYKFPPFIIDGTVKNT